LEESKYTKVPQVLGQIVTEKSPPVVRGAMYKAWPMSDGGSRGGDSDMMDDSEAKGAEDVVGDEADTEEKGEDLSDKADRECFRSYYCPFIVSSDGAGICAACGDLGRKVLRRRSKRRSVIDVKDPHPFTPHGSLKSPSAQTKRHNSQSKRVKSIHRKLTEEERKRAMVDELTERESLVFPEPQAEAMGSMLMAIKTVLLVRLIHAMRSSSTQSCEIDIVLWAKDRICQQSDR
jgi:hypothetical protein